MTVDPVALARDWAAELPHEFNRRLAAALNDGAEAVEALKAAAALPWSIAAAQRALELARAGAGPYTSGALTALLDTQLEQPTITPVWTGPDAHQPTGRLTLAVLADLLDEAIQEIFLVSYATYPGPEIRAALARAVARQVKIIVLLERSADNPHFTGDIDPFPGLAAQRLHWPVSKRTVGASMHAKLLVIDRHTALVGSANLTGFGLERNLECGLLLRGGPIPAALADHVLALHRHGYLEYG